MTKPQISAVEREAIGWCARVRGDMEVDDWRVFTAWLDASPGHRETYDAVEAFWEDLESPAAEPIAPAARRVRTSARPRRRAWLLGGLAAAAAILAAVLIARPPSSSWSDYATAPGQLRTVVLEDGSRLTLGPATHVRARLARGLREVQLVAGASAFDVAHAPDRPFVVTAGDRSVRVLGTEFDIVRAAGQTTVTVRRGLVAVGDLDGRSIVRLGKGQQLAHREGSLAQAVRAADPDQAFGWTRGQLYYDRTPLAEVAADFSRYGPRKVRVEVGVLSVRVTGVFKQDDQAAMVRRLEAFAPIRAQFGRDEIILKAR